MDTPNETPTPAAPNPAPQPAAGPTRRRNLFGGALLGAVALTASVVGISAVAGAQDDPEVDEPEIVEMAETDLDESELDEGDEHEDMDGEFIEHLEISDEEWAAFDQCFDDALGSIEEPGEDVELTDAEWDALDQQFEAAEEACVDTLPESIKAEIQAFDAFDQCLTDAGFSDDMDGAVVYVEGAENGQAIMFGDAPGTVTITGDANGVSVATDGDVSVLDEAAIDEAFTACEDLLPEGALHFDEGDFDEDGEWLEGDFDEDGEWLEGDFDEDAELDEGEDADADTDEEDGEDA